MWALGVTFNSPVSRPVMLCTHVKETLSNIKHVLLLKNVFCELPGCSYILILIVIRFKAAVVPTEIILEIITNKYTQSELHILGFGEWCDFCWFRVIFCISFTLNF